MKTFDQCCDEVAKKYGFEDYLDWRVNGNENHSAFHTEAAELYAQSKAAEVWEEASNECQKICNTIFSDSFSKPQNPYSK